MIPPTPPLPPPRGSGGTPPFTSPLGPTGIPPLQMLLDGVDARGREIPLDKPESPIPARRREWWEFITDERVSREGDDVTMWSEYLGTNDGAVVSGFDAKCDENPGGFVAPIEHGDRHPVHDGLFASQIDVNSPVDGPIRVRVKWVGQTGVALHPIDVPALGGWRPPPNADGKSIEQVIKEITRHDCERCGSTLDGDGFKAGGWPGGGPTDRVCRKCAESDDARHRAWRIAASIGGLAAWGAGWWVYASLV